METRKLGRYEILGELGKGAMGVVYRARDPMLDRTVAVKTINMALEQDDIGEYEARFYQEAKAAGGLNHPNLITIHDIGREGDIAYMAMELLEGVELRELIARGRPALPLALDIAAQVADGLAYAHDRGVVHRDIKPANIMIVRERIAKIMDFGVARMRVSDVKTQTGAIIGSPKYMSPEQVTGQPADRRSDIFSLGIVLFELATGEPPFSAPTVTQLMQQIAVATPRPPSAINPSVPTMLDLITAKALEKQAVARYQSAAEFAADLRACLAEISGQPGGRPAGTAANRMDLDLGATAKLDVASAKTQPLETEGVKTVPSETMVIATDTGTHLPLSRRFDSSEALQQLAGLSKTGGAGGTELPATTRPPPSGAQSVLMRLRQDPGRLAFAAAVIAAIVIALVIAFV